ncbi:hypothetical protein GALL_320200 [mine drainage metagenome]|uniref:Uncharacterized protein n=1 Tax=mine drainage metagenome TaxID=410659 RepID=A0A1J5RDA6_9ZZZZ
MPFDLQILLFSATMVTCAALTTALVIRHERRC